MTHIHRYKLSKLISKISVDYKFLQSVPASHSGWCLTPVSGPEENTNAIYHSSMHRKVRNFLAFHQDVSSSKKRTFMLSGVD